MTILASLAPILGALMVGWIAGRVIPQSWRAGSIRLIGPLVWLLLFLIGMEFGEVVSSAQTLGAALYKAGVFALLTTLIPCLLIGALLRRNRRKAMPVAKGERIAQLWQPLKECAIALLMVALGGLSFVLMHKAGAESIPLPLSWSFLLLLIALVGIDLAQLRLDASWRSPYALAIPLLVVAGSLLGACGAAWLTGEALSVSLALSSGFGWFTLSSVMIGNVLGQDYGTVALMTDLLRELLAIAILYLMGTRHPFAAVGSAGATALDSTLPIVKQACATEIVPLALVSGFVLTVLAPVLMASFLAR
ncbi:Membrane protein of uncharacterised function (DUF340) [Bordetella ansorpii]|uniref:Membrane protein of uncharacterized function (DUF340) n=1 Tax=Bordetella ansorpii TaxID=288768 RepID=A0A157SQQ1_9BORD|nr:lysine exporter LysO family protein [Bordetella ansorpii]SAI72780.1 Membrane protein of uncharacterised function (DUF340) [Bordetella ansorpii]